MSLVLVAGFLCLRFFAASANVSGGFLSVYHLYFLRLALYVSGILRKRSVKRTPCFGATKKGFCKPCFGCQFSLFAVLMQRVQTYWVVSFPLISTFTFLRLALYVLGVFLLEWLTRLPDILPLPQIAHTLDIFTPPCK